MVIFIVCVSILGITSVARFLNRILPFKICPICAGVSVTWTWIFAGILLGKLASEVWQLPVSILMGGSIVGLAYQLEKKLPQNRSALWWKILFIPFGFAAAYGAISFQWKIFYASLILLASVIVSFFALARHRRSGQNKTIVKLEEKMKNCC